MTRLLALLAVAALTGVGLAALANITWPNDDDRQGVEP